MIEYDVDERRKEVTLVLHEDGEGLVLHEGGEGIIDSERQGPMFHEGGDGRWWCNSRVGSEERSITYELEDLGDIEVEVREYQPTILVEEEGIVGDWSTSDDDDNDEVNSMERLVNINIDCDFRE
ncbi:hypothetical protein LR48_Vigan11g042200 [Vigna angularis]|uniref:Uncharacterized protein n=1 Tax=Phaseolus angularis TaxID=3914 RepID=A0A0L9VRK3_PHAAN|nr:hypothetical protein LR48_Vigan11g042200 [Vigna angularis]